MMADTAELLTCHLIRLDGQGQRPGDPRVAAVLGYLAGRCGLAAAEALRLLADSKGDLFVVWKREPRPTWRQAVEEAWEEIGNEPNVSHDWRGSGGVQGYLAGQGDGWWLAWAEELEAEAAG